MNAATQKMLKEIIEYARTGKEVYPAFFQPIIGSSNTVSAAIRHAKKAGILEQSGIDGCGKPKYRLAIKITHQAPGAMQ